MAAVVGGEAAVADDVPAVAVGDGNGVPTVAGGGEVIANDTTGGEAAIADGVPTVAVGESNGVPTVAGGGEVIANCLLYTSPSPRD